MSKPIQVFVAFDCETSGLNPTTDHLIKISAVRFVNGAMADTFSTLIQPGQELSRESLAMVGLNEKMLRLQPSPEQAIDAFSEFVEDDPLVGCHTDFLIAFFRKYAAAGELIHLPTGTTLDLVRLSRLVDRPNEVTEGRFSDMEEASGLASLADHPLREPLIYGRAFLHLLTVAQRDFGRSDLEFLTELIFADVLHIGKISGRAA